MFEQSRRQSPAWTSVFVALAGLVYSTLNALGKAEALCITTGCDLFKDITIYGYSLWWVGSAFFSLSLLLCLLGKKAPALGLSKLGLFIDCLLLLFMAFTAPCVPCLIAAILIALLYYTLFKEMQSRSHKTSMLLIFWLFVFCPNLFATINESIGTWAIYGPEKSDMQIYFSPSCPVCLKTIERLAANPDARIAFHPVSEIEKDITTIHNIDTYIREGASFLIAFKRATREGSTSSNIPLRLRWNLYRNKAHLAALGVTKIPVLITNGMPQSFLSALSASPTSAVKPDSIPFNESIPDNSGTTIPNLETFAGCSQNATLPCNE